MKLNNYLFAVAALVAVVSCQKNEQPVSQVYDNSISFGLSGILTDVQTKAYSENTATQVQANGFNVAGLVGTTTTMFNEKATYASSKYSPVNGPYYYPSSGTMNFYAVYPVSQSVTITSGAATLSYSQNPDTDLLAASATGVSASSSSVALAFDHILSLLKFKAVGSDSKVVYKVKSIKVEAPTTGTYSYSTSAWAAGSTKDDYTYSSTTTQLSGTTTIAGALTIIPCTPTIKVEYDVYAADGSTLIYSYTKSGALSDAVSKGKECTITMTLPNDSATGITFTITVNPWGTETQSISF